MPILKKLRKETKFFFYYLVIKGMLKGISIDAFKKSLDSYIKIESSRKYSHIHKKLVDKQMLSSDELDFLVNYVKENQWQEFKK